MPGMVAGLLVARPVDDAAEPVEQRPPGGLALVAGVAGVGVDPVLEGVDRGDPGEDQDDPLEQLAVRAVGARPAVERVEVAGPEAAPWSSRRPRRTRCGLSR